MTKRRIDRQRSHRTKTASRFTRRELKLQSLEKRELLAGELGPRLISVAANSGQQFRLGEFNELTSSPKELTFRFDGGQEINAATLSSFRFIASGGDGDFTDNDEITIVPGYIGFDNGGNSRIIVARFGQELPDDQYRISISGYDDTVNGVTALRNADGDAFIPSNPADPSRPTQDIFFDLELGPKVVAVVQQPVSGTGTGRTQARNTIDVYFNNDRLNVASAQNTSFYKLYATSGTVETGDDAVYAPSSATYDSALNRVRLVFASNLESLPGALVDGSVTFRLRVGSSEASPITLATINGDRTTDVPDTFTQASNTAVTFGPQSQSLTLAGTIVAPRGNNILWPGINAPYVRNDRRDAQVTGRPDTNDGINTFFYNFADLYGTDAAGNNLENAITPAQKQRVREVLDLYAEHLGVEFVETENQGLQFVTGDLRAIVETATTGPGLPFQEFRVNDADPSQGVLILDAGETWYDGYGLSPDTDPSYFTELLRGVGSLLGIGNTYDQVPGVASGSDPLLYNATQFNNDPNFSIEPDFLSTSDIIPGQALHRPEVKDLDLYRFQVSQSGRLSIETFAERLIDVSRLDTDLKLWKLNAANNQFELVARNDDFYGEDSFIGLDVSPNANGTTATYILGVTANGNDAFNPNIAGTGGGGRSSGDYEIRMSFERTAANTIIDTTGSKLDGDSDGQQGGNFDFWFRVAPTADATPATQPRTLFVNKTSGNNAPTAGTLANPIQTISYALSQAKPGDVVRLLPDAGNDGLIRTTADNRAFEIGRNSNGQILSDGEFFNVPKGVTVMIDAGAILKLQNAKIGVGSETIDNDRSLASLQVLGAPIVVDSDGVRFDGLVNFTSVREESRNGTLLGLDTNPLPSTPGRGDWAGIEFRHDVDYSEGRPVYESEGIFINYVSHADIRYGGGSVTSNSPIVTPLQLSESRPTLIYNDITFSSDAAISADPDSFLETNFHAPLYQQASLHRFGTLFTSDYDRVGPLIRGNDLRNNSINGLFIRVETPALGEREPMTVSGRFDDSDITHVLSEVLVLQGSPGGDLLMESRPDVLSTIVSNAPGGAAVGSLTTGNVVDYIVTFVTESGYESRASVPTASVSVDASRAMRLTNLPAASEGFASRRLYRRTTVANVPGPYVLVTALDRVTSTYTDDGVLDRGGVLPAVATAATRLLPRTEARLSVDPGLVLKLDSARIEATFGADFYAEGTDGNPIVFTSRSDDRYGAGSSFDLANDNATGIAQPGDWSGLVFRQGSTGSLDYVTIAYAGGESASGGEFTRFNPIEILQADVRVAHSTISNNADGYGGALSTRDGVGFNAPGSIFVRGSQPILVENTIVNNAGAAISINPDALNYQSVSDFGRSTGLVDRYVTDNDNQGPLIEANRLDNNGINGMVIRNEVLTTESVWDDTDIVHVPQFGVISYNHHHRGGLRLKSSSNESLVVKFNVGGSLTASRTRMEYEDSLGGRLQIVGQPGFPVVLTSLADSSVGAGFAPDGTAQTNTNGAAADTPAAGNWFGLVINAGANDRNVPYIVESERAVPTAAGQNAIANTAQILGSLAQNEKSADENRRLGFEVRGALSQIGDVDVFQFSANGGTQVFIDIDDSDFDLDTVVELIDGGDNILAISNSSHDESVNPSLLVNNLNPGDVLPLRQTSAKVTENPNPLDAGMRVILPGNTSTVNKYFVRVRSSNARPGDTAAQIRSRLQNTALVGAGLSMGQYTLSLRLKETDEVSGSSIRLADIRYATEAIVVPAAPSNSPLAGEFFEELNEQGLDLNNGGIAFAGTEGTANFANGDADPLGSISVSGRGVLRTSGVLGNNVLATDPQFDELSELDIDVYRVVIAHDRQEPNIIAENRFVSTIFDVDYADQLGRANTSLAVFDAAGRLILHSRDSSIADDQGRPTEAQDPNNLAAGSAGTLDAYIGPVEMPVGTYYVVVSSAQMIPESLNQLFSQNPVNSNVRVYPIDSTRRLAEVGFESGTLDVNSAIPPLVESASFNLNAELPTIEPLFDATSIVPYKLEDVPLFLTLNGGISGGRSTLISINAFSGTLTRTIGDFDQPVADLALRRDGQLFSYSLGAANGATNNGSVGNFLRIDSGNAAKTNAGDDGLTFRRNNTTGGTEDDPNAQLRVQALTFQPPTGSVGISPLGNVNAVNDGERALAIGFRSSSGRAGEVPAEFLRNILYSVRGDNGDATNQGSTNGQLDRDFGNGPYNDNFGPASNKQEFGVVDTGQFLDSPQPITQPAGSFTATHDITGIGFDPTLGNFETYGVTNWGYVYSFNSFGGNSRPFGSYGRIINSENLGLVTPDPLDTTSVNRGFVEFTGMTFGPRYTEAGTARTGFGPYAQVMFATTSNGWLYALQIDPVTNQVVPAYVLRDGNSALRITSPTGSGITLQPTGAAFSIREENPWHLTTDRGSDPGHGIPQSFNQTRGTSSGGRSLYFGFEPTGNAGENTLEGGAYNGVLAPGGAKGTVVSRPFSLENYGPGDKPTLYYSYFLESSDDSQYVLGNRPQTDSFRAFAAGDDGQWVLLATNNSFRSTGSLDEYDLFTDSGIPVQEHFDNTDTWRQARVDLSPLAGHKNVQIRFDYTTAGAISESATLGIGEGTEIQAPAGTDVVDGTGFTLRDAPSSNGFGFGSTTQFTFVRGAQVALPVPAQIPDGQELTFVGVNGPVTVRLVTGAPVAANEIQIIPNRTTLAQQIALRLNTLDSTLAAVSNGFYVRVPEATDFSLNPVAFGRGSQIELPASVLIPDGQELTFTGTAGPITVRLVTALPAAANEVQIVTNRNTIAAQIAANLNAQDPGLNANSSGAFVRVPSALTYTSNPANFGMPTAIPVTAASQFLLDGSVPIFYHKDMTSSEVRDAIRDAFARGLGKLDINGASTATIANYPEYGTNRIRVQDQEPDTLTGSNTSSVGISTFFPADEFGANGSTSVSGGGINVRPVSQNDGIEGVYIDDIVIGFAERGESVHLAQSNRNFVVLPEARTGAFTNTQQPEFPNEILVGAYTLEVRTGSEYGVPRDAFGLGLNEDLGLGRSFDTNDRLGKGVTLIIPSSSQVNDGDVFVLSNGSRTATFEFTSDGTVAQGRVAVPLVNLVAGTGYLEDENDTDQLATTIRDLINSPQVRNVLGIRAAGADGVETGIQSGNRIELFSDDPSLGVIQLNPSNGRFVSVDMVAEETFYGREGARTMPFVDHVTQTVTDDLFFDTFARATVTDYANGNTDTLIASGKIGDNVGTDDSNLISSQLPEADIDIVKIYLQAGNRIDVDLDTEGYAKGLAFETPRLQIFNATFDTVADTGFAVGSAPGESASGAFIDNFLAPTSGYYYVAVSSSGLFIGNGFGEYQLTIRPNTLVSAGTTIARDVLMVDYHFEHGDLNVFRPQGQFIIESNFIRDFANVGINASFFDNLGPDNDATFSSPTQLDRRPGSAATLRNVNSQRLLPGTVIANNVVVATRGTGIRFAGEDTANGDSPTPVPFGRLINNTVVGTGTGTGILIEQSVSPTVLNNLVVGFGTGISIDATSTSTVANGNAFQRNGANSNQPIGAASIIVPNNVQLFEDAAQRIFIPADNSVIIDSSFASLNDRTTFVNTVKSPVGISSSPILAPEFDVFGIPRFDDPDVTTPGGVGSNVFIDRGAIDRADFDRPEATLVSPLDFVSGAGVSVLGGDNDPESSFVRLPSGAVEFFEIQLTDPAGTGPDGRTITEETVIVTENGRRLENGVDYVFGYSDNSNVIRLTPLAGLWRTDSVYEITLNNRDRIAYIAPAGADVTDGDQVVVTDNDSHITVFEYDSGFSVVAPTSTTLTVAGTRQQFADRQILTIAAPNGNSVNFEINLLGGVTGGNVPLNLQATGTISDIRNILLAALSGNVPGQPGVTVAQFLDISPTSVGSDQIQLGDTSAHNVTWSGGAGLVVQDGAGRIADGDSFTYTSGTQSVTFEFDSNGTLNNASAIAIPFSLSNTPGEIATAIVAAVQSQSLGLSSAIALPNGTAILGGVSSDTLTRSPNTSNLRIEGRPGVTSGLTLNVPLIESGITITGSAFTLTVDGVPLTFRYSNVDLPSSTDRVIRVQNQDRSDVIATLTAQAIANAFPGQLTPSATGTAITVGEPAASSATPLQTVFTDIDSGLVRSGVSGGAIPIRYLPTGSPTSIAASLQGAIQNSNVNVQTFSPGGGTLLFTDATQVQTRLAEDIANNNPAGFINGATLPAITDIAGNPVSNTRNNGETRFTIIMPEVLFDFGDAPNPYATLLVNNGPRHTIGVDRTPRLGAFVDSETDGQPGASDDAAVLVTSSSPNAVFNIDNLSISDTSQITLTSVPVGGEVLTVNVGSQTVRYEFVDIFSTAAQNNIPVTIAAGESIEDIRNKLRIALAGTLPGADDRLVVSVSDTDKVLVRGVDDEDGVLVATFIDNSNPLTPVPYRVFVAPGTDPTNVQASDVLGFLNPLDPAGTTIAVNVAGSGLLHAWIDFDQNGIFESDEQVITNRPVSGDELNGTTNFINVFTPSTATDGKTQMRVRISESGNLDPTGVAVGGEVEDYEVEIIRIPLPAPVDDVYTTLEDNALDTASDNPTPDTIKSVANNDFIPAAAFLPVQYIVTEQPTHGTLVSFDQGTGDFVYNPDPDYFGVDRFTYRLSTQQNSSIGTVNATVLATVTINVRPVNDTPGGVNATIRALEDALLKVTAGTLLTGAMGDIDPQGDTDFTNEVNQNASLTIRSISGSNGAITAANASTGGLINIVANASGGLDLTLPAINSVLTAATPILVSLQVAGAVETFQLLPQGVGIVATNLVPVLAADSVESLAERFANAISDNFTGVNTSTLGGVVRLSPATTPVLASGNGVTSASNANGLAVTLPAVIVPTAAPTQADPAPVVGQTVTLAIDGNNVTFEFLAPGAVAAVGNIGVPLITFANPNSPAASANAAASLMAAMNANFRSVQPSYPLYALINNGATAPRTILIASTTITAGVPKATSRGTILPIFDTSGALIEVGYLSGTDLNRVNPTASLLDSFTFTITDNGVSIDPENNSFDYGTPATSTPVTISVEVMPQNDQPVLFADHVTIGPIGPVASTVNTDWELAGGATPTEDVPLIIPTSFLLRNDLKARATAIDENATPSTTDGNLSVLSVAMQNSAQGTVQLQGTQIIFTPAADIFGDVIFTYVAQDQGVNFRLDGTSVSARANSTGTVTITIQPSNDAPVPFNRTLTFAESPNPGPGTPFAFTNADLIVGAVGETPSIPGTFATGLPAPFNESEQTAGLSVARFTTTVGAVVNVVDIASLTGIGVETRDLPSSTGGFYRLTFNNRTFVSGTFTSTADFNQRIAPTDEFTFTIIDTGLTTDPANANNQFLITPARSISTAVARFIITETNDAPTLSINAPIVAGVPTINVLERDDNGGTTIPGFAFDILPGPPTATDETSRQNVTFTFPTSLNPNLGPFRQLPQLLPNGTLTVYPAEDQIGTATFVAEATDAEPGTANFVPRTTLVTFAVTVRAVNDAPRFNTAVAGQTASLDSDDAYAVDSTLPLVTYTFREDNALPNGDDGPAFIIPIRQGSGLGYNRLGLLDLFTVGPANEASAGDGGSQTLQFNLGPDTGSGPALTWRTSLGGTVQAIQNQAGVVVRLAYTPPQDFNRDIVEFDTFDFQVIDNAPGGETFNLTTGVLVEDRRTATGTVRIQLNPVNDRPEFTMQPLAAVQEDSSIIRIPAFARNIFAGPPDTAFDEVDPTTGQLVEFTVTSLNFLQQDADKFFSVFPEIDEETGRLTYQPAPNVYGQFAFEVVLTDRNRDGSRSNNTARGDLISSLPQTMTITVNPVNDPPEVDPSKAPITLAVNEDNSVTIDVSQLEAVFRPGPGGLVVGNAVDPTDESIPGKAGGAQTVRLRSPLPATSANSGTIQLITEAGVQKLRYTPRENFVGTDSFIYSVVDDGITVEAGGDANNPADRTSDPRFSSNTVTIEVAPINDEPEFSGAANVTVLEDVGATTISGWATNVRSGPSTAIDEASQTVQFILTAVGGQESILVNRPTVVVNSDGTANLSFETRPNTNGNVTYSVVLQDSGSSAAPNVNRTSPPREFTIFVSPVNDPPTFRISPNSTSISVDEDSGAFTRGQVTDISPGPADEQDQTVSFAVQLVNSADANKFTEQPTIDSSGLLRFIVAPNANTSEGPIVLQIVATDSGGAVSPPQPFTLTIRPVNDIPLGVNDLIAAAEDSVTTLTSAQLLGNDIDPDTDGPLTVDLLTSQGSTSRTTAKGALISIDPLTGVLTYDPRDSVTIQALGDGATTTDTFTYRPKDPTTVGNVTTVTLSITGSNDAPIVRDDQPTLSTSGVTVISVLANDEDVDGSINRSTLEVTFQPSFGTVAVNSQTGTIEYTPVSGSTFDDFFRYRVADNDGLFSREATVTLSANSAPVAVNDLAGTFLNERIFINVAANDTDSDGQLNLNSVTIVTQPTRGQAVKQANGSILYLPNNGFLGSDSFTYTIADNDGRVSNVARVRTQVVASRLQNPNISADVNNDGDFTPIDSLLVINHLRRRASTSIPVLATDRGPNFYDSDGDMVITPLDALFVINSLRRRSSTPGGEAAATTDEVSPSLLMPLSIDTLAPEVNAFVPESSRLLAAEIEAFKRADKIADFTVADSVDESAIDSIASTILSDSGDSEESESSTIDTALAEMFSETP